MRAVDERGKWLPKSRKVYDLDKNGERIRLPSGRWKSHKEDTVDWNDQKYAEIWRQGWADTANRYLEANDRPERLDLRSYARQGIDKIPTVHMGPAACQMEKKGFATNMGNLNRDIEAANSLMDSIRGTVRHLKDWVADLRKKRDALLDAWEQAKEPTIPELLSRYKGLRATLFPEQVETEVTLTVAECGEFHNLGEFHENIPTVDEAIAIWKQIPLERMNGIPAIGINIHTPVTETIDDVGIDILSGKHFDLDTLEYIPEIKGSPQAMEVIEELMAKLPEISYPVAPFRLGKSPAYH